eukprot:1196239-Prorocentrum_minimum.AAC.5
MDVVDRPTFENITPSERKVSDPSDLSLPEGLTRLHAPRPTRRNDPGKLGVWFGATRPQYMLVDSSGKFKDMSPNPQGGCVGPCGIWDSQRYASLLAGKRTESSVTSPQPGVTPPQCLVRARLAFVLRPSAWSTAHQP